MFTIATLLLQTKLLKICGYYLKSNIDSLIIKVIKFLIKENVFFTYTHQQSPKRSTKYPLIQLSEILKFYITDLLLFYFRINWNKKYFYTFSISKLNFVENCSSVYVIIPCCVCCARGYGSQLVSSLCHYTRVYRYFPRWERKLEGRSYLGLRCLFIWWKITP